VGGAPHDRFEPGERVGEYELVTRLAAGGMAELFVARRAGLQGFEKFVVLKRILPNLAGSHDFVEMFLHEARVAATLEHPNVVPVFDFGRAGDDYFFVMPYVHGRDLLQVLRESHARGIRFPLAHAVRIAMAIAAGLHYAHEHVGFDGRPLGIVHRDVSPANVLVTYDGHVKVVDFGIAKAAAQTNVTQVGVRKGKAAYMSPEQCRGDSLDRRADIWAIGVVLFEMAMMRRLFRGDNDLALMNRIVHEEVEPPSSIEPGFPFRLEAIIMRCLAKRASDRYPTAQALQQDLEAFARESGLDTSAAPLARFLGELFGAPSYPWASMPAGAWSSAPAAPRTSATSTPFHAGPPTEHGPPSGEVTDGDASAPSHPARAIGWIAAGTLTGLLAVAGTWMALPRDAPEASTTRAEAATPDPEELRPLLVLVNQPDPALALPYPRRHAALESLRSVPELAERIDARVNLALDLRQSAQSPDPCTTYAAALSEIARRRDAALAETVRDAEVPSAGTGCETLASRRDAVLASLR
jgi:serine/threonine protein kinase